MTRRDKTRLHCTSQIQVELPVHLHLHLHLQYSTSTSVSFVLVLVSGVSSVLELHSLPSTITALLRIITFHCYPGRLAC